MTDSKVFVGIRLEESLIARIDAIAEGQHGLKVPRSEVIRLALDRGLASLEEERSKPHKARKKG
jgi:metal-responsive CopG/Arc/MetJ family transcriptional regulator